MRSARKHSHSRRDGEAKIRASALSSALHDSMKGALLVVLGCLLLASGYGDIASKHFEMDIHRFEVSGVILAYAYDCAGARPCDHHRCEVGVAAILGFLSGVSTGMHSVSDVKDTAGPLGGTTTCT